MEGKPSTEHENVRLTNEALETVTAAVSTVKVLVESYGWFILIGIIGLMYIYQQYEPKYRKWCQKRQEAADAEISKKDPDKAYQQQLSIEQARLKFQQRVSEDAKKKKMAQEKREEEKRKEKIEEWDNHVQGKGYHSKYKAPESQSEEPKSGYIKPKKSMRSSDYNPLTGSSGGNSSSGFRPSRRNVSGGG